MSDPTNPQNLTPPRVLHIVYNLIRGGTEGQCARIAMGLGQRGWQQRVGVFERKGYFVDAVERLVGPLHVIGIRKMISLNTLREIGRLADFIRTEEIDLVHCWDADAAIFGGAAARRAGVPYMTSRRDMGEIYRPYKLWLMNRVDRGSHAIVVNAAAIGEKLLGKRLDERKIVLIPNLIDLPEFDRLAAEPFQNETELPGRTRIIHVSRLDAEKNIDFLIRAFAKLCRRHEDIGLVLAGEGDERAALEELTTSLNIGSRVLFLGLVWDVPALLRHCDIGVLVPSSNEGLSNSILEYMAASLPVVATDCGGNRELVKQGKTGFIIPSGDEDALERALEELAEIPGRSREMGSSGRQKVEADHDHEAITGAFAKEYLRIAQQAIPNE